jgi:hypothetical protein
MVKNGAAGGAAENFAAEDPNRTTHTNFSIENNQIILINLIQVFKM